MDALKIFVNKLFKESFDTIFIGNIKESEVDKD